MSCTWSMRMAVRMWSDIWSGNYDLIIDNFAGLGKYFYQLFFCAVIDHCERKNAFNNTVICMDDSIIWRPVIASTLIQIGLL
jgi:hypothetical protein